MRYSITVDLTLPESAPKKHENLSFSELLKRDNRCIGGDKGDLYFGGYSVEDGKTVLHKPFIETSLELSEEEANEIAQEILDFSYASIGIECVTHS